MPSIRCDHIGLNGWTAREMLHAGSLPLTLAGAVNADAPYDLAIVMAGTNDLVSPSIDAPICDVLADTVEKVTSDDIVENLWGLHEGAHKLGVATLAVGIPGSRAQKYLDGLAEKAQDVNRGLEAKCSNEPMASYFPCPVAFDDDTDLWEEDGLHMTAAGYEALGRALAPVVAEILRTRKAEAAAERPAR